MWEQTLRLQPPTLKMPAHLPHSGDGAQKPLHMGCHCDDGTPSLVEGGVVRDINVAGEQWGWLTIEGAASSYVIHMHDGEHEEV
jgi:hypothetical protein